MEEKKAVPEQKMISIALKLFLALVMALPLIWILLLILGFHLEYNGTVVLITKTILCLFLLVETSREELKIQSRSVSSLFAMLPVVAIGGAFLDWSYASGAVDRICILLTLALCMIFTIVYGKPRPIAGLLLIISVFPLVPMVLLLLLETAGSLAAGTSASFVVTTELQTVDSPGGTYVAKVIENDQGALGGDSDVLVYKKKPFYIDAGIFRISKLPKQVYRGEWGEFRSETISWEDDSHLLIHGRRYSVEDSFMHGVSAE